MTYRVSVCLLAYNHSAVIEDSILSVLAQDERDFELIVSDDCSRDDTWEVIQRIAATDKRIRAIRTPRNLGMAGNANFAVELATSPYIALLHHDDICRPFLLRKWLELAERHPNVAFVTNAYANYGSDKVDEHDFSEVTPGRYALEKLFFPAWGFPVRGTALIRRSCWDQVGGMRLQFGLLADVDLWMRLARNWDVGYVREPLITVRHEIPEDYPPEYSRWSWSRVRTQYEIFGTNYEEYFGDSLRGVVERNRFRLRVSSHEAFWLTYAVIRRRREMLTTSDQVANRFELPPVRALRRALRRIALSLPR